MWPCGIRYLYGMAHVNQPYSAAFQYTLCMYRVLDKHTYFGAYLYLVTLLNLDLLLECIATKLIDFLSLAIDLSFPLVPY